MILFTQIGPFQGSHSEKSRVKVKVQLNLHGIVTVESASVSLKTKFPSKTLPISSLVR